VQPTALIGRERAIEAVRERLLESDTRLLTLTGVHGRWHVIILRSSRAGSFAHRGAHTPL
jgi:hypothetical protein